MELGKEVEKSHEINKARLRGGDKEVEKIVANWNFSAFTSERARSLGFICEESMDEIIRVHIEDELGGKIPGLAK